MPSRRDQITMSEYELRGFLDERKVMQCATLGPNGRPHMVPLWFVVGDGGELRGWTFAKSQKARNLARDPRATLGVEAGERYEELRGAMFECDVLVEHDPDRVEVYGTELFRRYAGEITPDLKSMIAKQAQKRVGLRFRPTKTVTWDHRKLGGTY